MKKFMVFMMLLICAIAISAEVTHSYSLSMPVLKNDAGFTTIELDGGQNYGEPGQPALPWIGSKVLLPIGTEASDILVKLSNPQVFNLQLPIKHLQPQYPFSLETLPPPVNPDSAIYNGTAAFPLINHNGVNTQFLSGHPINFTAICPFEYKPASGELVFYQNVVVEISTQASAKAATATELLKQEEHITKLLLNSVDNTDQVPRYLTRTTGYEFLIVYDSAKLAQWLPYYNLYLNRGYNVLMKPIQEIITESTGNDTQEKLRNYIINFYATNSLHHVFLAGDSDLIPHRGFYVNMGQDGYTDADIPADMYYSCFDGTWNGDNDTFWGETYETDLAPEISIGRFCYNSDAEITNFYNKTNAYMNTPVESEVTTGLFVGEWLWDGPTWGGDYMDEMIGGSSMHGYTTVGVPTSWNISTLYDRTYGAADSWTGSQLRPLLSNGPTLVNHLGHSNTTYCMRMSNNNVTSSTITNDGVNHNFSIQFTQGCYAGAFDNRDTNVGQYTSDCITEKFTSIATSAVAMISHSRYGWGMQGSTDGASQYIHRQYVDAIFGEDIHELGYTLMDSKIDNIPYIQNSPVMYWVTYETNLFGDPGLFVWGNTPQHVVAQLPTYWTVGLNNYQIPTNAPNANMRIKSGSTIIFETTANAAGMISVNLLNPLTPGDYDVYIVAPDFYALHQVITVQASNMPYIVATQVSYDDQDGLYHTGEVVNMNVTIKNVGLIDQQGPGTLNLVSDSPNIIVLNSSTGFDALAAADSTTISGFFSFRIQGNYIDNAVAYMNLVTLFDTYTATTPVGLMLNAPELSIDSYQFINDTNLVMPGDNPSLNLLIENTGSGNAYNPILILFSDSPYVSLSEFEVTLGPVGHGSLINCDDLFTAQISPDTPMGTLVEIGYMLGAENGNTLEGSFMLFVGMQNYTFENDMVGWVSSAPNANFTNQWHRNNSRNYTSNGSYSLKFGGAGSADYANSAYGVMESPEIPLGTNAQLIFHHWMDSETHSNPLYAWDGGLVQISANGGAWTQISPVGGYPYRIYNNAASPFNAETNVYSGAFDWSEAVFDLSSYTGTARFRFVFGSDSNVTGEGWYIDDLHVEGEFVDDGEVLVETIPFQLHENYPNPFNPTTTIRFELPVSSSVSLNIFNLKGQLVKTLVNGDLAKGTHSIVWDGTDNNRKPVSSGLYLYRLIDGKNEQTRKMMLMK